MRGVLLAVLAGSLAIAPAAAQAPHPSISLTPSQFPGVLSGGVRIGPISLTNGTTVPYRVRAFPVLLGQHRDGGLFVRDDAASRARAARLVAVQTRRFDFPRGAARSVLARIRRIPRSRSLYGGVLFQATPRGKQSGQITNVLQLNASLLLDPPPALRRLSFEADEGVRAEPAGRRRLQLLVPVKNRGNVYRGAAGELVVRDSSGAVVARAVLGRRRILPGATVELPATVRNLLPAGSYQLSATIRGGRRPAAHWAVGALLALLRSGQHPSR
ncbi:MAG: hypothetical protein LC790_16840 [Actinobacteria bacterium]|nr:hypothetical protein [Actinomycetota bacterium]